LASGVFGFQSLPAIQCIDDLGSLARFLLPTHTQPDDHDRCDLTQPLDPVLGCDIDLEDQVRLEGGDQLIIGFPAFERNGGHVGDHLPLVGRGIGLVDRTAADGNDIEVQQGLGSGVVRGDDAGRIFRHLEGAEGGFDCAGLGQHGADGKGEKREAEDTA
jgi:hypothetical protein